MDDGQGHCVWKGCGALTRELIVLELELELINDAICLRIIFKRHGDMMNPTGFVNFYLIHYFTS